MSNSLCILFASSCRLVAYMHNCLFLRTEKIFSIWWVSFFTSFNFTILTKKHLYTWENKYTSRNNSYFKKMIYYLHWDLSNNNINHYSIASMENNNVCFTFIFIKLPLLTFLFSITTWGIIINGIEDSIVILLDMHFFLF